MLLIATAAGAQEVLTERGYDLLDRPISQIQFEGLKRVSRQTVMNNIRAAAGDPYDPQTVVDDVRRLTRLAEFRYVDVIAELQTDGSVALTYRLVEQELISVVQVVGNKLISDQDLLDEVLLIEGKMRDDYLIERAKHSIEALYRDRGHYLAAVTVDESQLEENGILIFRVIEGPRVRIRAIEFEGNEAFSDKLLNAQVETNKAIWLLRKGQLDEDVLADDVAALDRFYKDRGHLDVRVDRKIELSPDNIEAKVTFLLSEGARYSLASVTTENLDAPGRPLKVFAPEQIAALLEVKTGDVYRQDLLRKSIRAIQDAYGVMGYLDVVVRPVEIRRGEEPVVDLHLMIGEGRRYRVGLVSVGGNFLTKEKVIRRLVRLRPGRPFDATEIEESQRRIERTRLFNDVRITVQEPESDEAEYRDVLVEVKERNTGSFNFGIAAGSDSGVFGEFSLRQENFDPLDFPRSLEELFKGRAFRGAGQRFAMTFRPGSEFFQYSVSLTEPHFLETDYSLSGAGSFRQRSYDRYDEERISGNLSLRRRLGDVWELGINTRIDRVELSDIDSFAPTEIFEDAGPDNVTSLGVSLVRTTVGTLTRPGRGSRLELAYDRVGALGGDFDFNRASAEYTVFLTVDEDFLGRKSILRLRSGTGYIFGGGRVPTYERYYLGGRSLRGFEFRTVSPKGIQADTGEPSNDSVGGEWMFFAGAQYEIPLFEESLTLAVFLDSGTVTDDVGLDEYRAAIGAGLRLYIPQFGPIPMAFDFAYPLAKEDSDDTQVFSFTAELPF
ncbi:MAG: outer membrane protein assembly factor BamA [Phycisphaerales bacterium]|nr:MAG: outer membrane protein assembly factor BamA [Phycisphaerales bacterium]